MQSNNELIIRGTLKLNEFQKHQFYHLRKFHLLYFWFIVFLSSFALTFFDPSEWLINLFISLGSSALAIGLLIILFRLRSKREYVSDNLLQKEFQFQLTEDGILQTTEHTSALFEWETIHSAHKNKKMYRLYVSKNKAMVIPERFFASKEDRERFEKLISSHIPISSNKFSSTSVTRRLVLMFLGTGVVVSGLVFAESLLLSELMAPPEANTSSSWPITTTFLHEEIQKTGKTVDAERAQDTKVSNQNSKELGSFIFASRESPDKAHMIELREVVLGSEQREPDLDDERNDVVVRIYYGENGGVLEDFVQYDPKGMFISEDFEVNWISSNQATVNIFEENMDGEKVLEESFEIKIED